MSTASRVIKNTGFLYIKMGITAFVSLYTTRLILSSLGVSDFGIYNVVGGAIGMLGFLNSTLTNATQRFMSYAEGEGNLEQKKKIFNVSVLIQIGVALVTCVLLLGAMFPLFNGILNIDPARITAAKVVFFSLIISTLLTILNVPYDAVMNAHENMLYYSILGVFECLLRLMVAFICVYSTLDKLVVYGMLMAMIPLVTLSIMKVYCHRKYAECVLAPVKYWDFQIVKSIASFSIWNFLTAVSSLLTAQGLGLVLNHFFGTALNAAQGVANQLNGQLSAFSATMLKAVNPVIVKNAGARDFDGMNRTALAGCKFSAFLVILFAIPFIIEMPYILRIWLKSAPKWTSTFCNLQLIKTIIYQIATPAATAVYAQGDIKGYAIWKSVMNAMPMVLTYICFRLGGSPIWLYIPMICVWGIGGDIVILYYAKRKCNLSISAYMKQVLFPIMFIVLIVSFIGHIPSCFMEESFARLVITLISTALSLMISVWLVGLNSDERGYVNRQILKVERRKLVNKLKSHEP